MCVNNVHLKMCVYVRQAQLPRYVATRSRVVHSVGAKRTHEPVGGRGPFGLIKVLKAGPEPKALDRYAVTGYRVVTR